MTQFDESQWFHDLAQEVYVVLLCDIKHFMRIIHGHLFANTLSIGEIFMWVGVALLKLFASWLEKKTVFKGPMTRNFTHMSSALCSVPTPKTAVNYELIPLFKSGEENH